MNEQYKYDTIKKLVDENGNKHTAALKLGCSYRTVNRLIAGYKKEGKAFFIHGNRGRQPVHTVPPETKQLIVDLYCTKYFDANFTHFTELLAEHEKISVSTSLVEALLKEQDILSPRATRKSKRDLTQKLKEKKATVVSKKEKASIDAAIVNLEMAHPRRPRSASFGEMIQLDASVHLWFGAQKAQLHAAIDDATGTIVGAWFDTEETLRGYYEVLKQILESYGIPYQFYTDRRTVFEYQRKNQIRVEKDTFTQFGYACKQLGIEIKTTSVPQSKGRVERLFQTLQSRLPIELRLAGITTIEQANVFLNSYIKKHNAQFALPTYPIQNVFETQPTTEKINQLLAVLTPRKIDSGHSVRFNKQYYQPINDMGQAVYFCKGTTCMVIQAFDGTLFGNVHDQLYLLDPIPTHETISSNFDLIPNKPKSTKRHIPPLTHPWRQSTFEKHIERQLHVYETFDELANTQAIVY